MRTVSKIVLIGFKSLTYCLRSVSGPLLMQKWPSFLSQTNGFLCPVRCSVHFSAGIVRKHCLSQSAGINKFAVWFFLLADDVVYLEQCFLKADNEISCLQAFGFQDIKIRQTAHYSAANDLPGLKTAFFVCLFILLSLFLTTFALTIVETCHIGRLNCMSACVMPGMCERHGLFRACCFLND